MPDPEAKALDLDDAATRGRLFEWVETEKWIEDLKRQGYTDFYASRVTGGPSKGKLPGGAKEFGTGKFGQVLKRVFPRGGPDLVAVHPQGKILVGDITAGEWSRGTVPLEPGELHRLPAEMRQEAESVHHLVKTQRDAKRLYDALPEEYSNFEVHFQDRYTESRTGASRRFQVRPSSRAASRPTRLTGRTETEATRGLETAERLESEAKPGIPKARVVSTTESLGNAGLRMERAAIKARALAIGVKTWRAVRTVGKVLIVCIVPLKALDVLLEIALALWDRQREKKARKRRETQRAMEAVFREGGTWLDRVRGKQPPPTLQSLIERNILDNASVQQQFMDDWDGNRNFSGFQYVRVSALLQVETFRDMGNEDDEGTTTYHVESRDVYAQHAVHEFELTDVGEAREVPMTDVDRERLVRAEKLYTTLFRKMVQTKRLKHTIVPPLLTPFDIVIAKMNNLFVDIVQFTAQYTSAGQEIFTRPFSFNYTYPEWQAQFEVLPDFSPPLNAQICEYCLGYVYWAARHLSRHPLEQQDLEGNLEDPRKGWRRRFSLLTSLLDGSGTRYGKNFAYFADQLKRLVLPGQKDEEAVAALNELYLGARSIFYDLERIERNMNKAEYYYFGPQYSPEK